MAELQHMKQWYDDLSEVLTSISGIAITRVTQTFMEVCLLDKHSIRLFYDTETMHLRHVEVSS